MNIDIVQKLTLLGPDNMVTLSQQCCRVPSPGNRDTCINSALLWLTDGYGYSSGYSSGSSFHVIYLVLWLPNSNQLCIVLAKLTKRLNLILYKTEKSIFPMFGREGYFSLVIERSGILSEF